MVVDLRIIWLDHLNARMGFGNLLVDVLVGSESTHEKNCLERFQRRDWQCVGLILP